MATHANFLHDFSDPGLLPWQYVPGENLVQPLTGALLTRTDVFAGFGQAMAWVNAIADVAEAQDHHPDISIRYNRVTLTVSSHDAGGLTDRDLRFALAVNACIKAV